MKIKFLCLFILSNVFAGCISVNPSMGIMAFGQSDKQSYERLEGTVIAESFVVFPVAPKITDMADMGLKIGRYRMDGNIIKYAFQAEVHGYKWIFANSIRIKIDDKIYTLKDNEPIRQNLPHDRSYHYEVLVFDITPEMLEELKSAAAISAELYKRVVSLNEKQLEKFKEFLE